MTATQTEILTLRKAWKEYYPVPESSERDHRFKLNAIEKAFPEALTTDVHEIDDKWMARLRKALEAYGYSPSTIKSQLQWALSLLHYLGPRDSGNPRAIGLLKERVYCRKPTIRPGLPRRISLDDLSKFYVHCKNAKSPQYRGVTACDWWRAYVTLAYATGLRRGDLLSVRWDQLSHDDDGATLTVVAAKTGKISCFPLPKYAVDHMKRLFSPSEELIFRGYYRENGSRQSKAMRSLCRGAGIPQFTSHDIRRTACAEVERVRPGLGPVFLQHRPSSVTALYYLNSSPELREAVEKMRVPVGFRSGVGMTETHERKHFKVMLNPEDFMPKWTPVDASQFQFLDGSPQVRFRGTWFRLQSLRHAILLREFLKNEPLSRGELHTLLLKRDPTWKGRSERAITTQVARLRERLRAMLGLKSYDPLPSVQTHSNRPTSWRLQLPTTL